MKFNLKRIVSYCVPVFVLIILCNSPSITSTDYYPTEGWRTSTPEKQGIDSGKLIEMLIYIQNRDSYKYQWDGLKQMMNSDDWVQFFLDQPMYWAPGEKYEYCNGGSFILGAIIQKVTEMKLHDFADQYLFAPLGITDVRLTYPDGIGNILLILKI